MGEKSYDDFDGQIDLDDLFEIVLNTREQGQMMESLIKNQIRIKDEMIDKLHSELDYYKQDTAGRFAEQLMKAVIKIHKDMKKTVSNVNWEEMSIEDIKREYVYTLDDLTDLLEQQNIDSFSSMPGDIFDAAIHQPKIEVTSEQSLDKKVKESLADGYRKGEKLLIPERVIVYQYKKED